MADEGEKRSERFMSGMSRRHAHGPMPVLSEGAPRNAVFGSPLAHGRRKEQVNACGHGKSDLHPASWIRF